MCDITDESSKLEEFLDTAKVGNTLTDTELDSVIKNVDESVEMAESENFGAEDTEENMIGLAAVDYLKTLEHKTLNCNRCGYKAIESVYMKNPNQSAHDNIKFVCRGCGDKATESPTLIKHKQSIHAEKRLKCKHCGFGNQVELFLKTPTACAHEPLSLELDHCEFINSEIIRLIKVGLEVPMTYLVCPLCDAGFHQDVLIVKHMHRKCVKLKTIDWPENVFKTYILEPCAML